MNNKILESKTFKIDIKEYYYTSDLCLATILKMNKFPIVYWESVGGGGTKSKLTFYFKKEESIKKIVDDYFSLSIENHPFKKFYNEMREIKNIIYNC
jgi:hypothetical protein